MMHSKAKRIVLYALIAAPLLAAPRAQATDTGRHKIVGGVSIHLGVIPADEVPSHHQGGMHGAIPAGGNSYHIVIALFDETTGERVTDAEVTASLEPEKGAGAPPKSLAAMTVNGNVSYGNYFAAAGPGPYRIQVRIRRPGSPDPIVVEFSYTA